VPCKINIYVAFAASSVHFDFILVLFSPRPALGEFGTSATACRFETTTSATTICCLRPIILGDLVTDLEWMEAGVDSCPAGDCGAMASGRLKSVLDMALATPRLFR